MGRNHELFERALQRMPGGVNSPVRAFKSVGGEPFFAQRAQGPYLWDVEGKRYIDYVGSWGPMIAGHAHPHVLDAVSAHIARRIVVWRAESARSDDGGNHRRTRAIDADDAHGQLRDRGDAVSHPPRARCNRKVAHRQV